jgi:hypothetical protein
MKNLLLLFPPAERYEKSENVNQYFLKNELSFAKHLTHVPTSLFIHTKHVRSIQHDE